MAESYCVRLEKEQLVFSAAHFITYNGDICERLHGHNWGVAVEVFGQLDENQYVIDFIALRDTVASLVSAWDHRMLLPTRHPLIKVHRVENEVQVTFQQRRWVFPEEDCALLPVSNTTAEQLAQLLGNQLLQALESKYGYRPQKLRVAIDENHGQWGICEFRD